jgi:hypothetical protein
MYETHRNFVEWNKSYETGGMEMRSRRSELAWISDAKCKIIKLKNNNLPAEELGIVSEEIDKMKHEKNN